VKSFQLGEVAARAHIAVLAVGLLITLCASANAAPVHRFEPHEGHLGPVQRVTAPTRGSRMDRRRDPTVAVQRQCRLWLRLIVVLKVSSASIQVSIISTSTMDRPHEAVVADEIEFLHRHLLGRSLCGAN
jgi:hypothetical protein